LEVRQPVKACKIAEEYMGQALEEGVPGALGEAIVLFNILPVTMIVGCLEMPGSLFYLYLKSYAF
jgi:hypothetical protein